MHKLAKEMGKWALEWAKAKGYNEISDQGWDNLKDCMEAVKAAICADKEYREVEEMDEYGDMEKFEKMLSMGNDRMGYDRWRYANGRFTPKGRGTRRGYTPYLHMMEDMYEDDYDFPEMMNYRMGYSGSRGGNYGGSRNSSGRSSSDYGGEYGDNEQYGYSRGGQGGSGNQGGRNEGSRYGQSYDNYRTAKRHFTETKDPDEQKKMKEHIDEIFDDMSDITTDVIKDLTPEERQKYKQKMNQLIQKMQ